MNFKLKLPLILITFLIGLSSASLASAAFPTIAASNSSNSGPQNTSHTVNLPTGISSGNLLIVSFSNDGSATVSWPTGWTQLFSIAGTGNRLSVAYRIADGSEGTSITVTTSGDESSAHTSYRITGHYAGVAPAYETATTGSSTAPNPPSLIPSWGAADTLWLSVYGWDNNVTNSSYPTNYSLGQATSIHNNSNHGSGIASAGYNLNASSQDPGTATLSATETWVANTLAIRPMTASNITLGSGTDPSSATVAPGSGIRDAGAFTLQSDGNSEYVTALSVTLAGSGTPYDGVGEVRITGNDGSTTYFSAVSNPSSNTVSFSGGTAIPVTTTQTQFKIRITPKTHANMPVPAGASYDLSPYVSDWTLGGANNKTGSDSNANTLTIDNTSPNGATSTSGTGGTGNVALNWTTSSSTDFSRSVVLRWASSTPGSEVPSEGTDYTAGNTISTATVACVRTADSAGTAITDAVDGSGGGGGCLTTTLAAGSYSYKVFQKDSNGNYDTGVTFTGSPFTVTSGTVTQIFRSVGPGATGVLANDGSHASTVTVASGTATFNVGLREDIGVGDAVIIDTGGTDQAIDASDTLLFIHSRTSPTSYTLRTHTGATPSDIPINDTWAIYRAYTSLYNAEAGTQNTSIPITFNGGNRDLVANGEQWNIACYANGTTADTTAVTVDGWNTGTSNFIRIFTPVSATEVGASQRHDGKWDENKYRLAGTVTGSDTGMMTIQDLHVRIDGLQMRLTDMTANSQIILGLMNQSGSPEVYVSNNIIRGVATISYLEHLGILFYYDPTGGKGYVYNNIVYDFGYNDDMSAAIMAVGDGDRYFYNNTIHNSYSGFSDWSSNSSLKNNIVQNCVFGYNGTFDSSSDYNLSDLASDAPSPSYRYGLATEVTFVDEANDDFHLAQTDPYAKDAGTNLSADANLAFSTDIDGATRTSVTAWDIGADETATQIYRSVGPSATGLLASDSSHANTVTLTSGVATFSASLPDNIGVGDAVLIDTNNDEAINSADTLLFIHSRTSSTSYTLRTHTGSTPSDITINDTYQIYRAYTSLAYAENGIKNTNIPITFNGGNRDLVTNNEEWNIACYANGTTSDSTDNQIGGWSTGFQNFIKIYTPVSTGEVGVSQRHTGKWDENKWYIKKTDDWGSLVVTGEDNVIFEGLQIGTSARYHSGLSINYDDSVGETGNISVTNCIFLRESGEFSGNAGINVAYENSGYHKLTVKNCVIDGFDSGFNLNVNGNIQKIYIYNNTVSDASYFMYRGRYMKVVNNLMTNVGYFMDDGGPIAPVNVSDVSHLVTDGTVSFDTTGFTSIYENQSIDFVNPDNHDFHLSQSDTSARGLGINLTNDIYLPFSTDIDGQLRNPAGAGWDIGADEGTVEFVSTVMQSGGNFSTLSSWEDAIDSDLVADTTRVFSHGGITGTIVGGNTVTGLTSGATATVVYATSAQILLHTVSGIFQSGETLEVTAGNSVVISDNGNPASAVAKIDGAWTVADTTAVSISGWISGPDNYIKVYTTPTARHSGKWDEGKYRLGQNVSGDYLVISDIYTIVDGIQIQSRSVHGNIGISVFADEVFIKNNIIKDINTGIYVDYQLNAYIYNNLIYNVRFTAIYIHSYTENHIYGNTLITNIDNIEDPISNGALLLDFGSQSVINNIIQGFTNFKSGTGGFKSNSDYNITDTVTASGGIHDKINTTVSFVSTTLGAEDFHLSQSDTAAKDAGTDLSTYFSTDIDGATRNASINNWDIGADETATRIFRSVGPSATGLLASDSSHANTVTLTSGVATFSVALADNIGVGDAVIIDTNGGTGDQSIASDDTLLFIHSRTSSTSYTLRTHTGSVPGDIPINDTWQIYRAYTSLANAESGTINSTLSAMGFTFNGGNRDLMTNNEEWNIACYANGTTADSTAVNIDGWNTGAYNFVKVYTPVNTSEVGVSQRHAGKWDENKFRIETVDIWNTIYIYSQFVRLEGIQISARSLSDSGTMRIVRSTPISVGAELYFSDNVVKADLSSMINSSGTGIGISTGVNGTSYVFNNIFYDFIDPQGSDSEAMYLNGNNYVYNNTIHGVATGINLNSGTIVAKNNITQNCTNGYNGTFDASSDFNISDISSDAPNATFTGGFAEVQFIDEANYDFHLSQSDTAAKDAGTDLSTYFSTDIDGATRNSSINNWDIGADETATRIFRSVGPSATGLLSSDSSHANTVTLTSGVATFSVALPDNIGVGDAVIIDTSGTDQAIDASDTLLFIHSRTSSTSYTLRTHTGATPSDIPINDTYNIYRAYTSLANAEAGTINSTLSGMGFSFTGGNRDLLTNNEEWNIACYANGVTADSSAVDIISWNTAQQNFIKMYTPVNINEVGISQRHSGKWDEGKYRLMDVNAWYVISNRVSYTIIDGLQINLNNTNNRYGIGSNDSLHTLSYSNNIIKGNNIAYTNDVFGISSMKKGSIIYNNIVYDYIDYGIEAGQGSSDIVLKNITVANNSVIGALSMGIRLHRSDVIVKNNLSINCGIDFYYYPSPSVDATNSSYNLSSGATAPGTNSKINQTVNFVNEAGKDFHLAQTDTAARGAGANLSADANLPITTDIDGQLRNPSGAGWDIGADEGTVEFVSTVMQGGGNFSTLSSWEDAIDSDLVADTTRVFAHGGITGTIVGGNTVTGLTSGATATVVYATSTQILLHTVSGIFQSGETLQVTAGNSVVISDNGNPASAVAKIDGAWSVADTTGLTIDGWETGYDNYIKVYTIGEARHKGVAGTNNFKINPSGSSPAVILSESYSTVDGLEITDWGGAGMSLPGIRINSTDYLKSCVAKNNLIHDDVGLNGGGGISVSFSSKSFSHLIFNNIIYNTTGSGIRIDSYGSSSYVYNNTVYNNENYGIQLVNSQVAINNIVQNSLTKDFDMVGSSLVKNNISSDSTAPGSSGSKINTEVKFISTEAGNEDFHLHPDDRFAIDAGTDLSTYFTNDIDGQTRLRQDSGVAQWDIGADETATRIYRSVGPGKTDTLDNDTSHTKNVTLTAGVATFSAPLPDNVGVGDVVIIDTDNDEAITSADTLLFISKRNSSTTYQLQTNDGAIPSDITINDTYQIYRAHTSLANAEAGTINSTLSTMGFTFNGGNRDLVANNEQWNIACYANGTTADATAVTIDGWNTATQNFIKVYTPVNSNEVGISQRHDGKWDDNKYKIDTTVTAISINEDHFISEGLQIRVTNVDIRKGFAVVGSGTGGYDIYLSKNIIISSGTNGDGIMMEYKDGVLNGIVRIYNNIIIDYPRGIYSNEGDVTAYVYNNTVYNSSDSGFTRGNGNFIAKNNITQNCTDGYSGTFDASSDYNISDLAADAPGSNSKNSTDVLFLDEANDDFRLSSDDTAAKGAGLNLSTDTDLSFFDDIRGQSRPKAPDAWSIGACEPQGAGKIKLEGTQIKMEGDAKFE